MPYSNGATRAGKLCAIGVALLVSFLQCGDVSAQQASDNVEVMVCPNPSQSSLRITTPQSDSIVGQPRVTIEGQVEFISQIDFFINDTYNNTIALGHSATAFRSSLTLSPGTHTLRFVASDSCSQTSHTETVVMTYEPEVQPSRGATTPTDVAPPLSAAPVTTPVIDQPTPDTSNKGLNRLLPQPISIPMTPVTPSNEIDRGRLLGNEAVDVTVRTLVVIIGVAAITAPSLALSVMGGAAVGQTAVVKGLQSLLPFATPSRRGWGVRIVGVALLVLPFIV